MARLSSSFSNIKDHYAVLVIGSGYGGAIVASRLARAGQQVCLLERGKEFQPGEYPDTEPQALAEVQVDFAHTHLGSRTGLFDLRVNEDMNVFLGCGLGGTSLVNANVALRAEPRVYEDPLWPQGVRDDRDTLLEEGYRRAEEMLKPEPYPQDFPVLPKLRALEKSAAGLNEKFFRPPINVTFKDGVNHVGVAQQACKLCGDCVSGCNHAAKNTVLMNYLPDAKNHGAEIYTQVSVRHLAREDGGWRVYYQVLEGGREAFDAPPLFVRADSVILAAGTLGSTEILLRSKARGLPLSDQVGMHFTGNGDVLGFGYNCDQPINAIGFGHRKPDEQEPVGPCITGIIDLREQSRLNDGMVIEEGSIPGAVSAFLPPLLAASSGLLGEDTDSGVGDYVKERARELAGLVRGAYHGATHNTQVYLVMTHDNRSGHMVLQDDRLRIRWPGVGEQPIFQRVNDRLQQATKPLGGTYLKNPIWSKLLDHDLVSVHPLGGCIMAEDARGGVVNHKHQVFSGADGAATHEGLYVCDGAVVPRSLGVNPLLTISALAERCCALLAKDRGWQIDYQLPSAPSQPEAPPRLGLQFTETMTGYFSAQVTDDYQRAVEQGKSADSSFEFTLTVISDDLEAMLNDSNHQAKMLGTVHAPALSAESLTVTAGVFNLFVNDPERVGVRLMRYRMKLASAEGSRYYFEGFKSIHNDPGFDLWADTTTLYITVYAGDDANAPVYGKGILKILPADFARQLSTVQVNHAQGLTEHLGAVARFGQFFAGSLFDTFGGVLARPNAFAADAPPRKKRALRAPAPEVCFFKTGDGLQLRLTRYCGGGKGPVLLVHGLGVSSLIFATDTIETNLVEYLCAHGYDLWLLDFRASIDLPSSKTQFTADQVAKMDYPAAVAKVREVTGAASVQVVAHCVGSVTFFMAMLAGLQGVRAAVSSQVAVHMVAPTINQIKAGLYLPSFLDALGIDTFNAYVDNNANWLNRLFDHALQLYPLEMEERCNSAVCHRISFMYSLLYEHDQLNTATHEALHEMFGVGNMRIFEQLGLLTRKGHLVDAQGEEVYLPHLKRLAIPIAFIHGAENLCFLPESTERTFDLLRETNGNELYKRNVIPGYGHIDCIFGKNAVNDVYPFILDHLEATQ